MSTSTLRSDLKSSHWPLTIITSVVSLLNFLLPLVIVRKLTPEDFGFYKIFFLYLSTVPALTFSSGLYSGLAFWSGQKERKSAAYKTTGILIMGIAFLAGFLSFSATFFDSLNSLLPWKDWSLFLVSSFSICIVSAVSSTFFEESAITSGETLLGAIFQAAFELLRMIAMVLSVLIHPTIETLILSFTAVSLLKFLASVYLSLKYQYLNLSFDHLKLKGVLQYALPVSVSGALGIIVSRADQLILTKYVSTADFALYSIGCLSLAPILTLEQSITRVLIPNLAKNFTLGKVETAAALYKKASSQIAIFCVPVFFGLAVFATPIIKLLFGETYLAADKFLIFYSLMYLLLFSPYDAVARAYGESKIIFLTTLFFACFSLSLAYILTSHYSSFGALASYLITSYVYRGWWLLYNKKRTAWKLKEFFPVETLLATFSICTAISIVSFLVKPLFHEKIVLWFFVCGGAFPLLYFSALVLINNFFNKKQSPPRVLVLTQTLAVGGLERMVFSLAKNLKNQGIETLLFCYDHDPEKATMSLVNNIQAEGIKVISLKKTPGISFGVVLYLIKTIIQNKINIIHCQDIGGLIYATAVKFLTLFRIKIVQTQHSFIHLEKNISYKRYEKIFSRFADQITSVSEEVQNVYSTLGFESQVIPNGVAFINRNLESLEANKLNAKKEVLLGLQEVPQDLLNKKWLLYLARIFPGKGQAHAIDIIERLDNSLESYHLFFVGPIGRQDEAQKLREKISLSSKKNQITFVAGTDNPMIWLEAADIYISCSESEGMPLSPLEAVGSGIPAILSNIPGHEFLKNYAKLYNLDNPEEGATYLKTILCEIAPTDSINQTYANYWKMTQSLRDEYSIESMAGKYVEIYKKL